MKGFPGPKVYGMEASERLQDFKTSRLQDFKTSAVLKKYKQGSALIMLRIFLKLKTSALKKYKVFF
jgi:hypothetical protein